MKLRYPAALVLASPLLAPAVSAEPWIAVQQGVKCSTCHVNASGGGMRNAYGNLFAQMQLAANQLATADADRWTGQLTEHVAFGGNLRADAQFIDVPGEDSAQAFELDEARLYLLFSPLAGRIDVYLDQRVAPGASSNLEAYARYHSERRDWYVKAGRMFLPFGLRLEDDSAFIRTVPGINFTTPDNGIELGWESARWSAQLAISNGAGGGPETDDGKQASLRIAHVRTGWRAGTSLNVNDTNAGSRNMGNVFAGLRTGPVAWLAEIDVIRDETFPTGTVTQRVALLEANWTFWPGHNLKFTAERFDPHNDTGADEQQRLSVFWEYFPFEFAQLRLGVRRYDSDNDVPVQNRELAILQAHAYF